VRLRTIALSLIPGAAQIDLGRAARGVAWFFLFACLGDAALVAPLLGYPREVRTACGLAAAGVWILAFYDAVRLAARAAKEAAAEGAEPAEERKRETKPVA
jgi:hypothetical protein